MTIPASALTNAAYLRVEAQVRYWEDASINGVPDDDDHPHIPLKQGQCWCPTIDIHEGRILDWPAGTTADIHYKVCDAGVYTLLDAEGATLASVAGYVPALLAPKKSGWGDYIILTVAEDGTIANWRSDLSPFVQDQ